MNAIPTEYKGIRFRSRLEAKWACFFDLLGWQWEYEPIDLAGYIPDFAIAPYYQHRELSPPLLVEVKPIEVFDEDLFEEAASKAKRNHRDVLVVGSAIWSGMLDEDGEPAFVGAKQIGCLFQWDPVPEVAIHMESPTAGVCVGCNGFGMIGHSLMTYGFDSWCYRCGVRSENHKGERLAFVAVPSVIERLWAISSNETQWKPQR